MDNCSGSGKGFCVSERKFLLRVQFPSWGLIGRKNQKEAATVRFRQTGPSHVHVFQLASTSAFPTWGLCILARQPRVSFELAKFAAKLNT